MADSTTKKVSPQYAWQLRMKAEGRCTHCGKIRDGRSVCYCKDCLGKVRCYRRRRGGHQAWRAGKPGRVPFEHQLEASKTKVAKARACLQAAQAELAALERVEDS